MSNPTDNTLYEGSVSIEDSASPTVHGYGGLVVQHDLIVDSSSAAENKIELSANNSSFFTVSDDSETLTLQTTGAGTSQVIVNSAGTGADAVDINTTVGGVTVDAATSISLDSATDSNFTVTGSGQDLTLEAAGGGAQQVYVVSAGTGSDAIKVESTAGGVLIDANGGDTNSPINIQTDDVTNGINIGTGTTGVPITIGTGVSGVPGTSLTSVQGDLEVFGDLVVNGDTTTINTETLTVEDPIFALNFIDNGSGKLDYTTGGIGIDVARSGYDSGSYHVRSLMDICSHPGSLVDIGGVFAVGTGGTTLVLTAAVNTGPLSQAKYDDVTPPLAADRYLSSFVIKVTSGPDAGECRRITAWTGSASYTATVLSLPGVAPGHSYELYAPAKAMIWDESENEFAFILTGDTHTATVLEPLAYCDVHVGKIVIENELVAPCFKTEEVILPADATTAIDITCTKTRGSFLIMVESLETTIVGGDPAIGASATFNISKRDATLSGGSVARVTHSFGKIADTAEATGKFEKLRLTWPAAGKIQLKHQVNPSATAATTITYCVRVICVKKD